MIPALIRSVACSNGHFKGYWQQLSSSYELLLPVAVCSESRSEATDSPKPLRISQTVPEWSCFACSLLVLNWLPWPLCRLC